jgi:hypothetical protein
MGKFSRKHCAKNPFKKMDAMYNGKPGIQKEDFEQFSSMKTPRAAFNKKGPCWKGYEMIGMKKKGGRMVPNCVSKK